MELEKTITVKTGEERRIVDGDWFILFVLVGRKFH